MKKMFRLTSILLFVLILTADFTYAQKPIMGEKGFTFGFAGIPSLLVNTANTKTGSMGFKYFFSDKSCVRASIRIASMKKTTRSDTSGTGIDTTVILKTSQNTISFGWQHSIGKGKNLDPYVGLEGWYGGSNGTVDTKMEVVSSSSSGALGDVSHSVINNAGKGVMYGIRGIMGFNYFIADHFALGAEFGYGPSFSKTTNGLETTTRTGSTFGAAGTFTTSNSASVKSRTWDTNGSGMITVSVFF